MKKKYLILGGIVVVILFGLVLLSNQQQQVKPGLEGPDSLSAESVTGGSAQEKPGTVQDVLEELPQVLAISLAEQTLLDNVWLCLEEEDYEAAARVLNDNEQQLQIFFYSTLEAGDWLYDGRQMTNRQDGTGLVFRRPTAVYYGSIQDGFPEGEGVALQAVYMDAKRYDYAVGTWVHGKLDGQGVSGYRYYEVPETDALIEIKKEGYFYQDLLDGTVAYESVNKDGERSRWNFTADKGTTVLDESWVYNEEKQEYQLFTENDDRHAYILYDSMAEEVLWVNSLKWE